MEDESQSHLDSDQDHETELVRQLLSVKRHEKPTEAYFETFLTDFQTRQRSEMLSQSARGLLAERVGTWWWGLGGKKWVYGATAATAVVALGVAFKPDSDSTIPGNSIAADAKSPAAFEMSLPAPSQSDLRPPALPSNGSLKNGFTPVSAGSLQEL